MDKQNKVLYIVVSAAAPAEHVQDLVKLAQSAQWQVCILSTPQARRFLNVPLLEQQTGYPVRSEYRQAQTTPIVIPLPDALVVVPATFNTTNKIALGIADNLATSIIGEAIGRELPILVVPCANHAHLGRHPAFLQSLERLRSWGIGVLFDLEKYPPRNEVPWPVVFDTLHAVTSQRKENL